MGHYPSTAYRQLFLDGRRGGLPAFDPAEDGDHYQPEPNFFEWWYFDAAFADGSYLVAILHSSLFNAVDHKPTLDLRYYPPEGDPVTVIARYDRAAYQAAADRCRVKIGPNLAIDEGDRYRLCLRHELLKVALNFWPRLPGCRVGTGHIFADPASRHHFDWVVPLPRARVEGIITWADRRCAVEGIGYHDHNWGNVYLPAALSRWTWARVLAGDWTLVFGDVVGRGTLPVHVTPLMLARGTEIVLTTDLIHIYGTEPMREPRTGASYYRRLHLTTREDPALELTLTSRRAIEAVDFAAPHSPLGKHPYMRGGAESVFYLAQRWPVVDRLAARLLGKGSYLRWEADFHLCLPDDAFEGTGQALYETLSF